MKLNIKKTLFAFSLISSLATQCFSPLTAFAGEYVQVSEGTYWFQNVATGLYLDCNGNPGKMKKKANIQLFTYTDNNTERFTVKNLGGNRFSLQCADKTSLVVNINAEVPKNGDNVNLWTFTNDPSQTWAFWSVDNAPDTYYICSNANDSLVLNADGTKKLSNVSLKKFSEGNPAQMWKAVPYGTTAAGVVDAAAKIEFPEHADTVVTEAVESLPVGIIPETETAPAPATETVKQARYNPAKMVDWATNHLKQDISVIKETKDENAPTPKEGISGPWFGKDKCSNEWLCASFVSQCLKHGDYDMKHISGSKDLCKYLKNSSDWEEFQITSKTQSKLCVGDVIASSNKGHVGIITGRNSKEPLLSAHNAWALNQPLSQSAGTFTIGYHYIGD